MKLTIAIPTYNRAKRLEKALVDLCAEINSAGKKADIEVYVSNNGSTDDTAEIIMQCGRLFSENDILFFSSENEKNKGFDANILTCYLNSKSEYIWFLSDDDNIINGAIDAILRDINQYRPSVIFYNFDQKPYDQSQPYIKECEYFDQITDVNIIALQKIVKWPKLSALVIKRCESGLEILNQDSGFAHVALALQCAFKEGGVLHSPIFAAYPDDDYKDHIDFPPYIANNLVFPIRWVLQANNKMSLYEQLAPLYTDPLIVSLNTLGAYYRGRHMLSPQLKQELWSTIQREMRSGWIKRLINWKSINELFKFPISIVYSVGCYYIMKKKLIKNRWASLDN